MESVQAHVMSLFRGWGLHHAAPLQRGVLDAPRAPRPPRVLDAPRGAQKNRLLHVGTQPSDGQDVERRQRRVQREDDRDEVSVEPQGVTCRGGRGKHLVIKHLVVKNTWLLNIYIYIL